MDNKVQSADAFNNTVWSIDFNTQYSMDTLDTLNILR